MTTRRAGWLVSLAGLAWFGVAAHGAWDLGVRRLDSDARRQWVPAQYVLAGRDPYALSRALLEARYGPTPPPKVAIFNVPPEVPPAYEADVLRPIGPPSATYPPSVVGLIAVLTGWIESAEGLGLAWLLLNGASLIVIAWALPDLILPAGLGTRAGRGAAVAVAMMLFSPFFTTIVVTQLSLLVLAGLLISLRRDVNDWLAGAALALALMKPSISLPFLVMPVLQRRWRVLATAAAIHTVALTGVVLAIGKGPFDLTRQWMAVSKYFLEGLYCLQEIINAVGWKGRPQGTLASLAFLAAAVALIVRCRRAPQPLQLAFLCAVSMTWMYHLTYDFVAMLPSVVVLAVYGGRPGRVAAVVAFVLLSAGCSLPVINGLTPAARAFRWGGRLATIYVLFSAAVMLVRAAKAAAVSEEPALTPERRPALLPPLPAA